MTLPDTLAARPVPTAVLDAYRADPDFRYDHPAAEGPSLLQLFWSWLSREVLQPLADASTTEGGTWVLGALAVVGLAWVLARVLRAGPGGVFSRDPARAGADLLDADAIAAVDLDARLAEALAGGRHREAVRWRFLRLLQRLDGAGRIAWRRDKTNLDYVREVAAAPFADAVRVFDHVWYGERPVDARRYARLDAVLARAEALAAGAGVPESP